MSINISNKSIEDYTEDGSEISFEDAILRANKDPINLNKRFIIDKEIPVVGKSNRIRKETILNVICLKVSLVKEIFKFLTVLIKNNRSCQENAFDFLDCYVMHFKLVPNAMKFVGSLISSNRQLAEKLD